MNWKNTKEVQTDLFIVIGLMIIILGFIDAMEFSVSTLIISGMIISGVGIFRALKEIGGRKK